MATRSMKKKTDILENWDCSKDNDMVLGYVQLTNRNRVMFGFMQ